MRNQKILLGINIFLCLVTVYGLLTSVYNTAPFSSFESFIKAYASNLVFLFALVLNGFLVHRILIKKQKKFSLHLHQLLTVTAFAWLLLFFLGYFLASNVLFPIICIAVSVYIFKYAKKFSPKIAVGLLVLNILVTTLVIGSSFEEDYCVDKGTAADVMGTQEVATSRDDVRALPEFDLTEGQMIRVSFRTHMLCHTTYKFGDAVKEKYLFL